MDIAVLWEREPQENERLAVIEACDGELIKLYDRDPTYWCWTDAFTLGRDPSGTQYTGLTVDVAHFLLSDVNRAIQSLVVDCATDEPTHNIAKVVTFSEALWGDSIVHEAKASLCYPDELAIAMVQREGQMDYFWRWKSALARGHNEMLIHQHFSTFAQKLLRTLLALIGHTFLDSARYPKSSSGSRNDRQGLKHAFVSCGGYAPTKRRLHFRG